MKATYVSRRKENTRLILIMTGWSTGPELFGDIRAEGWDVAVVHDFTEENLPEGLLDGYYTVYLFAWSMGVFAAERLLPKDRITESFAINGTALPADDLRGIPTAIYDGTAENLTPASLKKFRRRMMPSAESYSRLFSEAEATEAETANLQQQLKAIRGRMGENPSEREPFRWTRAYVSSEDRIFPPANMRRFWEEKPETEIIELPGEAHYTDLRKIIGSVIADTTRVGRRFADAATTYDKHAIAQRAITVRMGLKLRERIEGETGSLLEIGPGTGLFTREYSRFLHPRKATYVDISPVGPFDIAAEEDYYQGDAEHWIENTPETFDVIASTSAIQWFADIPRFLRKCARRLRPGGVLALSTFLPGNMEELDRVRPVPLRYPTVELLQGALAGEFEQIEIEPDEIKIEFRSAREVLMHLKHTGVGGSALGSGGGLRAMADVRSLTFKPVYIFGIKN
ncbi:MAG: DUF452 family protein [Muribaculaceae bacterium]|nr:DUF452 family protein [Muribaculaceae bacterium]